MISDQRIEVTCGHYLLPEWECLQLYLNCTAHIVYYFINYCSEQSRSALSLFLVECCNGICAPARCSECAYLGWLGTSVRP